MTRLNHGNSLGSFLGTAVVVCFWSITLCDGRLSQQMLPLPYNPTIILHDDIKRTNSNHIYVFQPITSLLTNNYQQQQQQQQQQLISIDLSTTLSISNISYNIISKHPPFLNDNDQNIALLPSISNDGTIVSLYTGQCTAPSTSSLWTFQLPKSGANTTGNWTQISVSPATDLSSTSLLGANFLPGIITFSAVVDDDRKSTSAQKTNIYVFGGMCPKDNATSTSWQSMAQYSNHMIRLCPSSDYSNYTVSIITSPSSPVAGAGFSLTGLTPSYLSNSNLKIQKKSFVLIGGHTQDAFISMNQVAIWSLPEEAWSFKRVNMPSRVKPSNDQATDDSGLISLDSRSGHTAVLTEDGSKLVVFGGWVGDVNQAAEPQLAILNLGTGYGGYGNWEWFIPENQPSGNGVYGHGATMLPGNIMMVIGGTEILTSLKRENHPGIKVMFFNATSLAWTNSYTNPENSFDQSMNQKTSGIGLRIAIGVGLAVVVAFILLCVGIRHRCRKNSKVDMHVRARSARSISSVSDHSEMISVHSVVSPWSNHQWSYRPDQYKHEDYASKSRRPLAPYHNSETDGHNPNESPEILLPHNQLTQHLSNTGSSSAYQATNSEMSNLGTTFGNTGTIHPIYEADENEESDESKVHSGVTRVQVPSSQSKHSLQHPSDPFKDTIAETISSNRQSMIRNALIPESNVVAEERNVKESTSDFAQDDKLRVSQRGKLYSIVNRESPSQIVTMVTVEEDKRSISHLSEHAEVSNQHNSGSTLDHNASTNSRSSSLQSFFMGINPFTSSKSRFTTDQMRDDMDSETMFDRKTQSLASVNKIPSTSGLSSSSGRSFKSAQTSIQNLTHESEHSLSQTLSRFPNRSKASFDEHLRPSTSGSPSKSKPYTLKKDKASWLGSLKKNILPKSESHPVQQDQHDLSYRYTEAETSGTSYDKDSFPELRRTASGSSSLWHRKQVKLASQDSRIIDRHKAVSCRSSSSDNTSNTNVPAQKSASEGEDDWHIEHAVENRLTQVMFTAPEKRLCVVDQNESEQNSDIIRRNTTSPVNDGKFTVVPKSSTRGIVSNDVISKRLDEDIEVVVEGISTVESKKDEVKEEIPRLCKTHILQSTVNNGSNNPQSNESSNLSAILPLGTTSKQILPEKKSHENHLNNSCSSSVISSSISKPGSNSRKSHVLEIVERMESQSSS